MIDKNILEKIKLLSKENNTESYEELTNIILSLSQEEIIELSSHIGYHVFARLCMGALRHHFVLLQSGASAIIVNENNEILLQHRSDNDKWGLPGGCQELGERFEDTIIREVKEETNLDIEESNLELIGVISGKGRKGIYPNGDMVFNNSVLYLVKKWSGKIKADSESKELKFFPLDKLPNNQHDPNLIEAYIKYISNKE